MKIGIIGTGRMGGALAILVATVGDEGGRALAALIDLTFVGLWANKIGNEGARALAVLTDLTILDLLYNNVGDEGARAFAALNNLTILKWRSDYWTGFVER
jgi:hypothetical protein